MKQVCSRLRAAGWPPEVLVMLVVLVGLLAGFQYRTLGKFAVLRPGIRYTDFQGFVTIVKRYVPLDGVDLSLAILVLIVCVLLVVVEFRKRSLSRFFECVFQTERRTLLFLAVGGLVLVRFYFSIGEFSWGADSYLHAAYAWISAQSFGQGEIPIWTNYFCAGTPYLQFYGFLFFYFVGLVNLVLQEPFFTVKVVLAVAHVVSGIGVYLLVRVLTNSRPAAFLGGVACVLSFWHTQQVVILGRLPVSVIYALLPFPFYFFERIVRRERQVPAAVWGGLALGGLALTHPGYGFWATALLVFYMVVRYWQERSGEYPVSILYALVLLLGGVILGACLTVPIWMERGYTGLHAGFYMSEFPVPTWKHLLWWSNYRFRLPHSLDHWYGGYLGVSLVALAAYGLVKVFRTGRREKYAPGLAAGLCLLVALILVFGYRWPVLRSLGVVQALSAGRYLLFVVFFLSVMVGLGAAFLVEAQRGVRTPERVFVLALLVVLVDLGPTTFQQPYRMSNINRRMDRSRFERLLEDPNVWALARPLPLQYLPVFERFQEERNNRPPGELSPERLFHTTNGTYYHFIIPWLGVNTGVPTVLDTYTQYPLSVPAFVRRFQDLFHTSLHRLEDGADLEKMEYFDLIQTGLFLLNTRHVFYSYSEEEYLQYREFPQVAPLVVAPRTARWTYPVKELDRSRARSLEADEVRAKQDRDRAMKDFSGLLRTMEVDLSRGTCKQILLSEDEPEEDLGTSPQVEILSHQVWNQRVELRVRTSDACFARLAYTYYPYQRLTVDGQVAERLKTAGHFVALRLAPGEHTIVLEPELSVLRTCLLFLSAGLLAAAGVVLVRFRRKEQRDFKR